MACTLSPEVAGHATASPYIVCYDVPSRVAIDLNTNRVALTGCVFVEQVGHDAALVDVLAVDARHPRIDMVVDHIQLKAALCDGDAAVHSNKVTLAYFQTCIGRVQSRKFYLRPQM